MQEPFIPHDLEGWMRVLATIVGAMLGAWGIVMAALKKSAEAERKLTDDALRLLRQERQDAMEKESVERKLADGRIEERLQDIAQKVHVWMGKLDLLTERIHEDRLAQAKEIAAMRLEQERGFNSMREMLANCPYREDHPSRGANE